MRGFIREFWLWILIPILVVLGGLILLYVLSSGDASSDFVYTIT